MKTFKEILTSGLETVEEGVNAKALLKNMVKALDKQFPHLKADEGLSDDDIIEEVLLYITSNPEVMDEMFQHYM